MRKMIRVASPAYLVTNWVQWGKDWEAFSKGKKPLPAFDWKGHREDLIDNYLGKSVQFHCSFCDIDQIAVGTGATIEHFKPKGKFPLSAYEYTNLFNCCNQCQKKRDSFNNNILNPDLANYKFEDYFEIELRTGRINANPTATNADKEKAEATITAYKLNNKDRMRFRLKSLEKYTKYIGHTIQVNDIDDYSYRFFIEEYCRIVN